jgi:hypothetical protein
VQEAGGTLSYDDLVAAMSFLAAPNDASSLPKQAATHFARWCKSFPSSLTDPDALSAALNDLIVMRHALNIRREEDGFVFFKGNESAPIAHGWTVLDARMALGHAVSVAGAVPSWQKAVSEDEMQRWAAAA